MNLKSKFRGFSGPVGTGKSFAGAEMAIRLAITNRGRVGLLGAPTYPMLRDATLPHLLNRLEFHGIPYTLKRGDPMHVEIHESKSIILLRSLSESDRLRGTNLAWFGVDELTYSREAAFMQLQARLRDPLAIELAAFGTWTPKGFDWVWQRFISAEKTDEFVAVRAKPFENKFLSDEYYQTLYASYSVQFARQEIFGEYLNIFSGRAYPQFDRDFNVWPIAAHAAPRKIANTDLVLAPRDPRPWLDCKFNPARPLIWALDFNINPAASVIGQTVPRIQGERIAITDIAGDARTEVQLNILEELFLENRTTYEVCDEFLALIEELREKHSIERIIVYVYGDPAGESRHSNAQRTDWQIIRDFGRQHEKKMQLNFRVRSDHPPVKDRVNCVNWLCQAANGDRRLLVHKRCKNLIADLEQVGWKTNTAGVIRAELDKDTDKMRTHISDALGYMIEREWPMRRRAGLQPTGPF